MQLSAISKDFFELMCTWVGVHLDRFSESSLCILLLQCFPSPFSLSYSCLYQLWKRYSSSLLKNDLSTVLLEFLQVHGPNVFKVFGDAFDCGFLNSLKCFSFLDRSRIYLCRSQLFGKSPQPSCNCHMQEQENEGVSSCPSLQSQSNNLL